MTSTRVREEGLRPTAGPLWRTNPREGGRSAQSLPHRSPGRTRAPRRRADGTARTGQDGTGQNHNSGRITRVRSMA